jgi:hypothetical protein
MEQYREKKVKIFNKNVCETGTRDRKQEFDKIDPTVKIPVLLTSRLLYDVLLYEDQTKYSAKEIYQLKTTIPIPAENNKLGRPMIPLFRHYHYSLSNIEHLQYKDALIKYFS